MPASDSGSVTVWGSKRINPWPQSCLCLTWSGCPSNDDDDERYLSNDDHWLCGLVVTALERCNETNSFISGISLNIIRQRLLENRMLTFVEAYEKARVLELAKVSSESYSSDQALYSGRVCTVNKSHFNELTSNLSDTNDQNVHAIRNRWSKQSQKFMFYFCEGFTWHSRNRCPAKSEICDYYGKLGLYAKYCLKRKCVLKHFLVSATNFQSTFSKHQRCPTRGQQAAYGPKSFSCGPRRNF